MHEFVKIIVASSIALLAASGVVFGQLTVPSESECLQRQDLQAASLQKFLITLVTRTCDLRTGFGFTCKEGCPEAILDIASSASGCLRYRQFGDGVFDAIRAAAATAGLSGEVPPREVMNMTELNDWTVQFCEASLFTGEPEKRTCEDIVEYTAQSGTITLPEEAFDVPDEYKSYLRCLQSIKPSSMSPGQRIKLEIQNIDLDSGDGLTLFGEEGIDGFPIISFTGRTPSSSTVYSPVGSSSLLLAFASDAFANVGEGYVITYNVTDDNIDEMIGCNDPAASNFDPNAVLPRTTACSYDFQDGSLLFSGSSGHVEVPSVDVAAHLPTREITMSTWVKVNEETESRYTSYISHMMDDFLLEKGFALGMLNLPEATDGTSGALSHSCAIFSEVHEGYQIGPFGYVYSELNDTNGESHIKFNEWQHVACTYDGLVVKLYVDGDLVASSNKQLGDIEYPPEDYDAKHSSSLFTIGAYHDSDDFYALHGELDETQLYNCALDEEAIKAAAAGRAGTIAVTEANKDCLMHWFRYNSNTGNTVENEIDIDRNGVIIDILGDQVFRADSSSLPA